MWPPRAVVPIAVEAPERVVHPEVAPIELGRPARIARLAELLLVAMVPLLLMGVGVALALIPRIQCRHVRSARADARVLLSAATMWQADNAGCPTVDDLALARGARLRDAWDAPFRIVCGPDGNVTVHSNGPDGSPHTEDDIFY